ncbi:unnamed protein product [Rotaria sp. Silwood2]|nr:unnamed protein product [Rotaria sp. Silwood2]
MLTIIQPSDYIGSIIAYISWQNETTKRFVERFSADYSDGYHDDKIRKIERAWNDNERSIEPIFLGGGARPLFSETVTNLSAVLSAQYNKSDPLFTKYRSTLFDSLCKLVRNEGSKYWINYDLFPFTTNNIIEQCLNYFYFHDRQNTFFINSSGCDYILYVDLARHIFLNDKFIGSPMTNTEDHNTTWILNKLQEQCSNICNSTNQPHPLMLILLTSKNRFGAYIDVDRIHQVLNERFPGKIVTLVDACQDAHPFQNVDIIVYSKRFSTTSAIALVSQRLLKKYPELRTRMAPRTNFSIELLAQVRTYTLKPYKKAKKVQLGSLRTIDNTSDGVFIEQNSVNYIALYFL